MEVIKILIIAFTEVLLGTFTNAVYLNDAGDFICYNIWDAFIEKLVVWSLEFRVTILIESLRIMNKGLRAHFVKEDIHAQGHFC